MPEKILIIDDERMIAHLTSVWVVSAGYEVVVAHDGRSGLAAAATHRPGLILLDIRMPDLDGFEVYRKLQDTPGLESVPVIFLSAHAQESTRAAAVAQGARFFLTKPYEGKQLLAAIGSALAQTRAGRAAPQQPRGDSPLKPQETAHGSH